MELPRLDLSTFLLSISSAAHMHLGQPHKDLEVARQNIDLLELMEVKTQGNRTPEEDRLLQQLLFEVRIRFVEAQK